MQVYPGQMSFSSLAGILFTGHSITGIQITGGQNFVYFDEVTSSVHLIPV